MVAGGAKAAGDSPVVALERSDGLGGGKAAGLRWLARHDYLVPPTWVIPRADAEPMALRAALDAVIAPGSSYAVRSSANVEDGGDVSYAGQFHSELGVDSVDGVVAAIQRVHDSASAGNVQAYRAFVGDEQPIRMSVLVQEMVRPMWSGVGFSRNPITGLNEVVVEAVAGSGEQLMTGGATPERWVHRWGDYVEQPPAAIVDEGVIAEVVATVRRVATEHGKPVDVEWVHDGDRLWLVQVRPISGIDDIAVYSRRIAKEVMPGIIKPLVWSINVPMVNQAWIALFREALGDVAVAPEDLARSFGYRSYFNMTAIGEIFEAMGMPHDSLELLLGLPAGSDQPGFKPSLGTFRKLPRMTGMAIRMMRYERELAGQLASLEGEYARFAARTVEERTDRELLADIEALRRIGVRAASVNIVTPLLANLYTAMLRRQLAKADIDLEAIDLLEDMPELGGYDPNWHLDELGRRIRALDVHTREAVMRDGYGALPADLVAGFDQFLERFGHLSESGNDFSVEPWREQPDLVVKMASMRVERDRAAARRGWSAVQRDLGVLRRRVAGSLRKRARRFTFHRESVSSTYTFGYGLFRDYVLEIGRRLVDRDVLGAADDVMYLAIDEVREALIGDRGSQAAQLVAQRRAEIEAVADLDMPDVIYGDDFIPRPADDAAATAWHGTATARGHHRGRVRVVGGLGDFSKVHEGDVVAIPYSDVGWTPLFAKVGAVIAESGGMLSHSSIVAREYGIPCVVSVEGAMRIPDGAMVTVDGYRGVIVLEEEAS